MDVDAVAERSMARISASMQSDSPLVEAGTPLCPWCEHPLVVRLTTLSAYDAGRGIYNDEIYMKCAGPKGCAWLPLFHAAIDSEEYDAELEFRDGQKRVDVAQSRETPDAVTSRLRELGYL